MFRGRTLVIATKHAKERVIGPVLEAALAVRCIVSDVFDTDELGTFTGEIERTLDPLGAAREKCRRVMDATGCDLAVASEGSFGPHPAMVFVPGDEEILVLVDRRHDLEVAAREVSAATNFASEKIRDEAALEQFAERAGFPAHALILRRSRKCNDDIHKGITERARLLAVFGDLRARYGEVCVETDMRALYNPRRMAVIEAASRKLAGLLRSTCPGCATPGFTVTEVRRGLPCSACGLPTESAVAHLFTCSHCGFSSERGHPHGRSTEDPMYCGFCNP